MTSANRRLKQIHYMASHDLRAPVNHLLSVLELLDFSKIEDADTRKFVEIIKISSDLLLQNLNKYVAQLKHPESCLNTPIERLSLSEILKAVLSSLGSLPEYPQAILHVDFSALECVDFHRDYLESIFLNLITNSLKYAQPDVPPEISIFSRLQDGVPQVIFSDRGLGFDLEQVKDRVFGFLETFHNHADSHGIGLFLVHNYMTSLGGSIELDSQVNQGATFTLSFNPDLL